MLLSAVIISSLTIFVHCWQYTVHILPSALLTMSSSSLDKVSKYFSVLEFGNVYPRDFTSSLECTLHSSNWNNLIHCNEGLSDLSLCLVYSESPWYFIIRAPSDLSYLFFLKNLTICVNLKAAIRDFWLCLYWPGGPKVWRRRSTFLTRQAELRDWFPASIGWL